MSLHTMKPPPIQAPVLAGDRIQSLDVLRGFALLGILLMNMQAYAMIKAAYMNPTCFGEFTGINRVVWAAHHILADLKFMTLFSMLFGAGVVLVAQRAEAAGKSSAALHYQRMFWLFVIGMIHAYGFWYADILVTYALCGFGVYLFRKLPPLWLAILGSLSLIPPSAIFLFAQFTMPFWSPESLAQLAADWRPQVEQVRAEVAAYRGGWGEQATFRTPYTLYMQAFLIPIWFSWRAGGLMLIGMALLKSGLLTAERPRWVYVTMALTGLALGLPLILAGVVFNFAADWSVDYSMFLGYQFNYWGSVGVALAYMALVMLLVKAGTLSWLQRGLAAMGRTALTNYLSQTLICTTLFYGHGLGWFGQVERWQQFLIAVIILAAQMMVSVFWLKRFRFGPMEWVWRSLTYRRLQPMRVCSST
jgi:uncharacterized protein